MCEKGMSDPVILRTFVTAQTTHSVNEDIKAATRSLGNGLYYLRNVLFVGDIEDHRLFTMACHQPRKLSPRRN